MLSIIAYKTKSEDITAKHAGNVVVDILLKLSAIDKIFLSPEHFNGSSKTKFTITEDSVGYIREQISNSILNTFRNDIIIREKENNPTVDYLRKVDGYSFNSVHKDNGMERVSFNFGIGYNYDGIVINTFNRSYKYPLSWYLNIFLKIIEIYEPFYATIAITNHRFNILYNEFNLKYKIGWKTYFSNDFESGMMGKINGLNQKNFLKGIIYETADDSFLDNKEMYENYDEELRLILKQIVKTSNKLIKNQS